MNVQPRRWRWQCLALIVLATLAYPAQAQDESLSPDINKNAVVEECEKAGFTFLDEVPEVMQVHYIIRLKKPSASENP